MKLKILLVTGLWSLVSSLAPGEVYVFTNNVLSLSPSAHPLTFTKDLPARYTVYARQSGIPVDLTDYTVRWEIRDVRDDEITATFFAQVRDPTNGHVIVFGGFNGWEAGTYRGRMIRYLEETNAAGLLADDFIYIVERCSTCQVINVSVGMGGEGGIVSNVIEGTENLWDAGTGSLTINTNEEAYLSSEWATNTAAQIISEASGGSGGDLTTLSNDVLGAWATASNAFDLAVIASNLAAVAETDPVWASWLSTNIPFAYAPVYNIPIEDGTATVYLSRGRYQRIIPTNVVEVSVEFNSKPTADYVGSLLLSINVTTALVTFATQYISEATASNIVMATNGLVPTSLILYSAASRTNEWGIYQLEP
jgi:hypothetical protein